jgi:hypothetical protein
MAELLGQHTPTRSDESTIETMSCTEVCGAAAQARFDVFLAGECGARRLLVTHVKHPCACLLRLRPGLSAAVPLGNDHRNVFHLLDTVRGGGGHEVCNTGVFAGPAPPVKSDKAQRTHSAAATYSQLTGLALAPHRREKCDSMRWSRPQHTCSGGGSRRVRSGTSPRPCCESPCITLVAARGVSRHPSTVHTSTPSVIAAPLRSRRCARRSSSGQMCTTRHLRCARWCSVCVESPPSLRYHPLTGTGVAVSGETARRR